MNRTKIIQLNILFCFFITFVSCEMIVDLEIPPHEPKLVVYSFFEEGEPWEVQVGKSVHVLEKQKFKPVTNATVKIFADGVLLEEFYHREGWHYEGKTTPVPGKTYKIEVSAPNFYTVTATDKLPVAVPLVSFSLKENVKNQWGSESAEIRIRFNDPATVRNYYQIELKRTQYYSYTDPLTGERGIGSFENVGFYALDNMINEPHLGLFDDKIFDGKQFEYALLISMNELIYNPSSENNLRINLTSLSKSLYDFNISSENQSWNEGDPFSEPIQVRSNIVGGYGIFAGKSSSVFVYEITE